MILADYYNITGDKRYELSNHLGNVLAVINDKKIPVLSSSVLTGYQSDVLSYSDYYPFEDGALRKCPVDIFSDGPAGAQASRDAMETAAATATASRARNRMMR